MSKEEIRHPQRYATGGKHNIECYKAIEYILEKLQNVPSKYYGHISNVIKYVWRCNHKNGYEDLEKASAYLDFMFEENEVETKECSVSSEHPYGHKDFIELCKKMVCDSENKKTDVSIHPSDVFVVWSCKTLQNSKAILSSHNAGAYLYEATMNGDKGEIYFDTYDKINNVPVDLGGNVIISN